MKCLPHSCQAISRMWGQPCHVPSMPMHFFRSSVREYARWCDPEQGWSTPCTSDFSLLLMDMGTWEDFLSCETGLVKEWSGWALAVWPKLSWCWKSSQCFEQQYFAVLPRGPLWVSAGKRWCLSWAQGAWGRRWRRGEESQHYAQMHTHLLVELQHSRARCSVPLGTQTADLPRAQG